MADEIRNAFPDADITLIPSKGGRFEVEKDGILIFSKANLGRHAKPGEVLGLIQSA